MAFLTVYTQGPEPQTLDANAFNKMGMKSLFCTQPARAKWGVGNAGHL